MGLKEYFSTKVSEIKTDFEASGIHRSLVRAIRKNDFKTVTDTLDSLEFGMLGSLKAKDRGEDTPLAGLALAAGQTEMFKTIIDKMGGRNGVTKVVSRPDQYTVYVTAKSHLYAAIENKNKEAALFLLEDKATDLEQGGWRTKNSDTIWQESPIEAARKAGMIEVTIALADRLGQKRRDTAQALFDEKTRQAMAFETEASELRKLDLVEGVYRLPEPYIPNSP